MKYLAGIFLGLVMFAATRAGKLDGTAEDFEKCKEGSELIEPPQCPEKDPELPVYLPFPYDCQQYYQCSNGIARCIKCAPGTVWDQENLVCNHIDAVNCPLVTTTTNPIPTELIEPPENVICDKEVIGLQAHPSNCSLFILCDPGRLPCIIECPEGTCFNNATNTCDYPNNDPLTKNDDGQIAKDEAYKYGIQTKTLNYRNVKRSNFVETVQFVAKTLTNRLLEHTDGDPCEFLNFYIKNT